jgi:hypothetical protein
MTVAPPLTLGFGVFATDRTGRLPIVPPLTVRFDFAHTGRCDRAELRTLGSPPLTLPLGTFAPLASRLDHKTAQPEAGVTVLAVKPKAARQGVEIRKDAEGATSDEGSLHYADSFGSPGSFQR